MVFSKRFSNYLSSGWSFSPDEYLLRQRFHLLNIVVALGFLAVVQGIIYDWYNERYWILSADIGIFIVFLMGALCLRKEKKYYEFISSLFAFIALIYLNFIILVSKFEDMEFVWFFFYVVTFMFLRGPKEGALWNLALFSTLILIKVQPFYIMDYTYIQVLYIIFTLSLVSAITYSFHRVIDENYELINAQRISLVDFNMKLENKVDEVQEKQEMLIAQSRLAAMGEMLSMIAHQWRQPLSTTTLRISNVQIKSMMDHKSSDERDTLLEEVSDTLVYLSDTIDDFQTYFKPDNKSEMANVASLMERAKNFVKARAEIYKIDIVCSGDEQVNIATYPNEMVQVVINILNNAIDVIVSSGNLKKQITLQTSTENENVCIRITDSGDGIDEGIMERIFEPYFSTKSENGTGLGLYMVKMIIEEHIKGKIYVQNSQEGGAEFCIELPLNATNREEIKI